MHFSRREVINARNKIRETTLLTMCADDAGEQIIPPSRKPAQLDTLGEASLRPTPSTIPFFWPMNQTSTLCPFIDLCHCDFLLLHEGTVSYSSRSVPELQVLLKAARLVPALSQQMKVHVLEGPFPWLCILVQGVYKCQQEVNKYSKWVL